MTSSPLVILTSPGLFQSTHLIRGVTSLIPALDILIYISIHTPHTRCDLIGKVIPWAQLVISIHTPHTRCDRWLLRRRTGKISFQSTHLIRGVTWRPPRATVMRSKFQSTHLIRGVTINAEVGTYRFSHFNPHTSYEVWRQSSLVTYNIKIFQSTHLIRGVTGISFSQCNSMFFISIHTPHTRCDDFCWDKQIVGWWVFQSTHLIRGCLLYTSPSPRDCS